MFTERTTAVSRYSGVIPIDFDPNIQAHYDLPNGERLIAIRQPGNELESYRPSLLSQELFSFYIVDSVVDSKLLKLEIARFKNSATLPSVREIKEYKEGLLEEMERKTQIKIVQCLVDRSECAVYFSSKPGAVLDSILMHLVKAYGVKLLPMDHATVHLTTDSMENGWPELNFCPGAEVHPEFEASPDIKMGRAFLTWCWGTDCEDMWAQEPCVLKGESMGAKAVKLSGGTAIKSEEIKKALSTGKLISSCSFQFNSEDFGEPEEGIIATIDENFSITGVQPPVNVWKNIVPQIKVEFFQKLYDVVTVHLSRAIREIREDQCQDQIFNKIRS